MLLVDLLERVGAVVRRHLRDELGGLTRSDALEELGPHLLVHVLEHVRGTRRPERGEEFLELVAVERVRDVGEVGGVDLLRLHGDVRRRFRQQRDDVGRQERRDRPVLWVSLRWRHGHSPLWVLVAFGGGNIDKSPLTRTTLLGLSDERQDPTVRRSVSHGVSGHRDRLANLLDRDAAVVLDPRRSDGHLGAVDSGDGCQGRKHGPHAVLAGHSLDGHGRDHARNIGR